MKIMALMPAPRRKTPWTGLLIHWIWLWQRKILCSKDWVCFSGCRAGRIHSSSRHLIVCPLVDTFVASWSIFNVLHPPGL